MADDDQNTCAPFEQAPGVGLGPVEFRMVLARSYALSAVSNLLATGMQRKEQTVRQQLREWYDDARRKRGPNGLASVFAHQHGR